MYCFPIRSADLISSKSSGHCKPGQFHCYVSGFDNCLDFDQLCNGMVECDDNIDERLVFDLSNL